MLQEQQEDSGTGEKCREVLHPYSHCDYRWPQEIIRTRLCTDSPANQGESLLGSGPHLNPRCAAHHSVCFGRINQFTQIPVLPSSDCWLKHRTSRLIWKSIEICWGNLLIIRPFYLKKINKVIFNTREILLFFSRSVTVFFCMFLYVTVCFTVLYFRNVTNKAT